MSVQINDFQVHSAPDASTRSAEGTEPRQDAAKDLLRALRKEQSRRERLRVDGGQK
ncbi:hypothetical protein [Deinococcus cellulosilyticus]|uniref:Uncharacterized protein n=1 Tax=Deinococcus cellulosilyticus (strain DSM 18568 / NBRC 106333 / KACC 11606 / 5516J-15) TaxID=1223518 RepID=A0A511MZI8_DEIC1|nr:hypothetical protein [Deinococcus cellulosilyticus]GEM46014.1 hypothetical protein DC3_16490 [Deinococcus cellulosilyticus NBRC 106333 = KACC 11606]